MQSGLGGVAVRVAATPVLSCDLPLPVDLPSPFPGASLETGLADFRKHRRVSKKQCVTLPPS